MAKYTVVLKADNPSLVLDDEKQLQTFINVARASGYAIEILPNKTAPREVEDAD